MRHPVSLALRIPQRDRLLLYAADPSAVPDVIGAAPGRTSVRLADSWESFHSELGAADCAVVAVADLRNPAVQARLARAERAGPLVPRVLIIRPGPHNLAALSEVTVDGVLLAGATADQGRAVVDDALASNVSRRLARAVRRLPELPPRLRSALAVACAERPPIHTVTRLARRAGVGRSWLSEQWSRAVGGGSGYRLEDLLHDLELTHALEARVAGTPVTELADAVGVSAKTLARRRKAAGVPAAWLHSPVVCRRAARALAGRVLARLGHGATG